MIRGTNMLLSTLFTSSLTFFKLPLALCPLGTLRLPLLELSLVLCLELFPLALLASSLDLPGTKFLRRCLCGGFLFADNFLGLGYQTLASTNLFVLGAWLFNKALRLGGGSVGGKSPSNLKE